MGTKADKKMKKKTNKEKREGKEEATSVQAKSTATVSSTNHEGKAIKDPRFSSVHSDPRFQRVPKHQSKVAIDSRFNRMFSDKNFSSSSVPLDKRGKPKNQKSENPLRHYYRLDEEEEEEEKKTKDVGSGGDDDEEDESEEIDNKNLQKLASSLSSSESSSESEPSNFVEESESETSSTGSDTDGEDGVDSEVEDAEPEENIPVIEQETRRLAIVNMDWSQIRAVDLYVLMSSFLPKDGQILSVSVYPSEFGLKCMEEEAVHGPIGLFDSGKDRGIDDDDDNDDEIDNEKLRAYEKRRLRYYYAVVECDSSATADYLYKSCDGTEFERTSNVLDLRFIPDSMEFKHPPRDVATEAPTTYEGVDFQTRALQHSKIHLSWEEDEPQRAKILRQKFNADQLAELELNEFLASDDGESIDDENDEDTEGQSAKGVEKLEKYRALLQGGDGSDRDGEDGDKDMEVTFNTGLEDISKRILEKNKGKESETVWEAYLRKRREKKKERKNRSKNSSEDESSDADREESEQPDDFFIEEPAAKSGKVGKGIRTEKQQEGKDAEQEVTRAELELLLADDQGAEQSLKGYNLKPKKAKGKKGKEDIPSEAKIPDVDYDDPRFLALFKSSLFALDPTDPQYKRSAAYARKLAQKQQKGAGEETTDGGQVKPPKQTHLPPDDTASKKDKQLQSDIMPSDKSKYELSSLVRSVKKKAQQAQVQTCDRPSKKRAPLQFDGVSLKRDKHGPSSLVQSLKKRRKF